MTELTHENTDAHDHIHLPPPTAWPLVAGAGLLLLALGLVFRSGHIDIEALKALSQPLIPRLPWLSVGSAGAILGVAVLVVAIGGWLTANVRERMRGPVMAGDSKMAMWVFLANEIMFLTGLIASFLLLRYHAADPQVDKALLDSIPLVGLNTFVLLASSLTVVLAHQAAQTGRQSRLVIFLILTVILGSTFVSLQGVEYTTLYRENLKWTTSGYGTAFFTLTGTHGLHVIVGILWCLVILIRAQQGGFSKEHYGGVEIFGLYWHFVDIVWILLFTLVYLMHRATPPPPEAVKTAGHLLLTGFGLW
jgi:heme/copper-type cytochrome/quinol oxidase subunit 3